MNNIAVVCSPDIPQDIFFNRNFYKSIPDRFLPFLLNKLPVFYKNVELPEIGIEIALIQFPELLGAIDKHSEKRIINDCRKVIQAFKKLNAQNVVFEHRLWKNTFIRNYFNSVDSVRIFDGKRVYLRYIQEIIRVICSLLKVRTDNIRFGIVLDELENEQIEIIKKVSHDMRFLSILSYNRENLIPIIESIYEETGLAIEIGSDAADIFSDCGIIINFSKNQKFVSEVKFPDAAVVVNFGCEIHNKRFKGIIINDIYLYSNKIPIKSYAWLSQSSFCDALAEAADGSTDRIKVLDTLGYKVSGFWGINGKIQMSEFGILSQKYQRNDLI